jgi:hypothetical protein
MLGFHVVKLAVRQLSPVAATVGRVNDRGQCDGVLLRLAGQVWTGCRVAACWR